MNLEQLSLEACATKIVAQEPLQYFAEMLSGLLNFQAWQSRNVATVPARVRQVPVRQGCPQRLVKPHPSWLTQQSLCCRGASAHHEEPLLQRSKAVYFGKRSHATATQQAVEQILREAASTKFGTNFAQPLTMQSLDDVIAAVPLLAEDRERGRARTVVLKAEQVAPYLVQRKLVEGILYSIAHGFQVVTQSYVAIFVTQETGTQVSFIPHILWVLSALSSCYWLHLNHFRTARWQ